MKEDVTMADEYYKEQLKDYFYHYFLRPSRPYRGVITPSSLYKANCPRCTWMSYWWGFSLPANLALQQQLSRFQENFLDGIDNHALSPLLPKGTMNLHKGKITSSPIRVNGEITKWKIYGEIDFLCTNEDGTYSIIDGKVSLKKNPEELIESYWTQLEAYAFLFEHPDDDIPKKIATLGLIQWRITGAAGDTNLTRNFSLEERYIPVERRPREFQEFIAKFIGIIEGFCPEPSKDCYDCKFLHEIGFYSEKHN